MTKTAVVALGGNALTLPGQAGRCEEMLANAVEMAIAINEVMDAGWRVVVHGNGPQVGNPALQHEATTLVPGQPLAALNAMTQGQLGSPVDLLRGPGSAASLARTLAGADADGGTRIEPSVSRAGPGR